MSEFNEMLDEDVVPTAWVPSNSIIKVIGVGGGGCNAVNYMYNNRIEGCSFIVANTDSQALQNSPVPIKIQLGPAGLGAGTDPRKGAESAILSKEEIERVVLDNDTQMLFITAGMGGGTGTGASPVIAQWAKSRGILTVGVVTLPFKNEKNGSLAKAVDGINELKRNVDSLLIIDNQKIFEIYGDLMLYEAFPKTDEVLATAVKAIVQIITKHGYINVDFRDVQNMMRGSGLALMGSGEGRGANRLDDAVTNAMSSPLLMAFDSRTARNSLIYVTIGKNKESISGPELDIIDQKLAQYLGNANRFKRGIVFSEDPDFGDRVCITVIATGIKMDLKSLTGDSQTEVIFIDEDYEFVPDSDCFTPYEDDSDVEKVGICDGVPQWRFSVSEKPLLCVSPGESLHSLENESAISRRK